MLLKKPGMATPLEGLSAKLASDAIHLKYTLHPEASKYAAEWRQTRFIAKLEERPLVTANKAAVASVEIRCLLP